MRHSKLLLRHGYLSAHNMPEAGVVNKDVYTG